MNFEWDKGKNKQNILKHGISFEEAKTVFYNQRAIVFDDPEHSKKEDRLLIVGFSTNGRLIVVSFCERFNGKTIRIISSRKLSFKEASKFIKRWLK